MARDCGPSFPGLNARRRAAGHSYAPSTIRILQHSLAATRHHH